MKMAQQRDFKNQKAEVKDMASEALSSLFLAVAVVQSLSSGMSDSLQPHGL